MAGKTLKGLTTIGTIPWPRLLERACTAVLKQYRRGEPTKKLEPSLSSHIPFILNPLIYQGHPTLIFAPGGSCKSYLALYFALLVCHGLQQSGVGGVKAPVLYLDWELNEEATGSRLRQFTLGHPELNAVRPYYRRCELPLHKEVHAIAATVADLGVKLVIIDSAAMACGGDLASPDAAIGLQQVFRKIGCASLTLAHVAKHTQEGQATSPYGTVYFRELTRNLWEITRADDSNPARVMLTHVKDNFNAKHAPMGFEIDFQGDAVRVAACDPNLEPEFDTKLPLPSRIRNFLDDGNVRTAQEIAEALGVSVNSVRSALRRQKGTKWHQIGENRDAKWTCITR